MRTRLELCSFFYMSIIYDFCLLGRSKKKDMIPHQSAHPAFKLPENHIHNPLRS